jgi:hypothetical protein
LPAPHIILRSCTETGETFIKGQFEGFMALIKQKETPDKGDAATICGEVCYSPELTINRCQYSVPGREILGGDAYQHTLFPLDDIY